MCTSAFTDSIVLSGISLLNSASLQDESTLTRTFVVYFKVVYGGVFAFFSFATIANSDVTNLHPSVGVSQGT